ncbi:hypothetical protein ES702_06473 [subsurface metagenome]
MERARPAHVTHAAADEATVANAPSQGHMLLDAPEVMLAQSAACNITFRELVVENQALKARIEKLHKELRACVEGMSLFEADREHCQHRVQFRDIDGLC